MRARWIDEIFLALPWHAERRISCWSIRLAHLPVDLKLCPDRIGYAQAMVIGESLAGIPLATLHRQPIRDWGRIVKRAMDVGISALLLFLLAPLLAGRRSRSGWIRLVPPCSGSRARASTTTCSSC